MTILGIPTEKSIVILMIAFGLFSFVFSILSFMGKLNSKKNYTAEGITEEKTTPNKKDNLTSGFLFLSFALTSTIGALKYLTNNTIFGYIALVLLLISLVLFIVSEKQKQ